MEKVKNITKRFDIFESSVKDMFDSVEDDFTKYLAGRKLKEVEEEIKELKTHNPDLIVVIFDNYGDSDYYSSIDYFRDYPDAEIIKAYIQNSDSLVYKSDLSTIYIDIQVKIKEVL